jgi:hypothetical protein
MSTSLPGLWLITSGAYVSQELAVEFGRLPPAFLPVGIKRLYEYQLESFGVGQRKYITIPETFVVPEYDRVLLERLGAVILGVPDDLSLGESVTFALNLIGAPDQHLYILHGDTLIAPNAGIRIDVIAVAEGGDEYSWAEVKLAQDRVIGLDLVPAGVPRVREAPVVCGWFSFASSAQVVRMLTSARGNFLAGIVAYGQSAPLRAMAVENWYDFGHLSTYFRSRRMLVSARSFNSVSIEGFVVRKSSADTHKMRAEVNWLSAVPAGIRLYSARLIDHGELEGRSYYETEYAYLPTLAELFVFGTQGYVTWRRVFQSCRAFLSICSETRGTGSGDEVLENLCVEKTAVRLRLFQDATRFDIHAMLRFEGKPMPSLAQIAEDLREQIDFGSGRACTVMHGDFCFSNILYDSRVQRIHVIDPRGYINQGSTIFGDLRYDLAKLAHSIVGRYDQIISGRYRMPPENGYRFEIAFEPAPHQAWLEQALKETVIDGVSAVSRDVWAITISLFLSMLPLHADRPDRQRAFIATALRLYAMQEMTTR